MQRLRICDCKCDMIFASADSRFGFPEIKLGTIPGVGGTQRLTKAVGKQKVRHLILKIPIIAFKQRGVSELTFQAMELVLTGSPTTASEMERYGIVNRVIAPESDVVEEALKVAQVVAAFSSPAIGLAKQAVKAGKLFLRVL